MSQSSSNTSRRLWIILVVLLLLFLGLISQAKAKPKNSLRLLLSPYAKYSKWINAMARVESGNFTNTLSTKYNNIFSMGFPTIRKAKNSGFVEAGSIVGMDTSGEPKKFSVYKNYDQAIADLLLWFEYNNFPKDIATVDSFVHGLKDNGYFKINVPTYITAMKSKL